ncbi:MAG: hypothetical protein HDR32_07555 [Treponema sp.]|nr:hypothetical protein [Treponema sp.]
MKKILFILACVLPLISCNDNITEVPRYDIQKEFEILSSEIELNTLLSRGDEGIVDWELSKEFAQMALESFIEDGDYPATSELWNFPIGIYDDDGKIRYYEFRVIDNGNVIAAITCNAREELGGPLSYIFNMNGYMDTLTQLYNSGAVTDSKTLRIVDNAYPSYAVAFVEQTRSGDIAFNAFIDPVTGNTLDNVTKVLTIEETFETYPKLYTSEEQNAAKVEIAAFQEEIKELWKSAKANKGSLTFRGKSKKIRTEVDTSKINYAIKEASLRTTKENSSTPISYGACGATASGFILDYLLYNNIGTVATEWKNTHDLDKQKNMLRDALGIASGSNITWPEKLQGAISKYSNYTLSATSFWPTISINNNILGINLRSLKCTSLKDLSGGFHYRNVIGYKEEGWWIFKWQYIKIIDGNNIDAGWEAYIPLYHLKSWNVVKK